MKKLPITLIVLTQDEEKNLPQCLKNAAPHVSELIVVDSGSTDKTLEIAHEYGAQVLTHPFKNQAESFNWALKNAKVSQPWILRLDADEWVTPELWEELEEKLEKTPQGVNGYVMKRRVIFMGRWIRHGGYYPTWFLRLFRTGTAEYEPREMDEHLTLERGRAVELEYDFVDENRNGIEAWVEKHVKYASREAEALMREEKSRTLKRGFYKHLPLFLRAVLYWKYRYFIRLGFLDGGEGLVFHFLQGLWYRMLVDAKLYEAHSHRH